MPSLINKTALVTGASRGIGRATAEALAKMGADVIVHYGRSAAAAVPLVAGIRAAGGSADSVQADLSIPEGAAALAKQVRAIVGQRLDIFVSNAGVSKAAAIEARRGRRHRNAVGWAFATRPPDNRPAHAGRVGAGAVCST